MSEYHDEIAAALRTVAQQVGGLNAPAPAFTEMGGQFLDYQPGKAMQCVFPTQERFGMMAGLMQGGFLAAAIDNVYGHFALLEMRAACVTTTLNTTFIRAIPVGSGNITVEVRLRQKNRSMLFMDAKVLSAEGRTSATSSTVMVVPKPKR